MRWADVLYLVTEETTENDVGDLITTKEKRMIYTNKKSIRQSEFYQAQATGLKPELAFDIRSIEYKDEEFIEYDDKEYRIIRTYDKGEILELICQGVVNDGDA